MSGQDDMSWHTASLYSFGDCWSIAIFLLNACEKELGLAIGLSVCAKDVVTFLCESRWKTKKLETFEDLAKGPEDHRLLSPRWPITRQKERLNFPHALAWSHRSINALMLQKRSVPIG
jgi:hypothetical protein